MKLAVNSNLTLKDLHNYTAFLIEPVMERNLFRDPVPGHPQPHPGRLPGRRTQVYRKVIDRKIKKEREL